MSSMAYNWLDYVFIAIFFFSALAGFGRGFIREIMGLAALVFACFAATMYANELALSFTSAPAVQSVVSDASNATGINAAQPVSYVAIGISFGLIFAGTYLIGVIVAFFVNLAFSFGVLGLGNRILGGLFGLCRAALINLVLIFMIQLTAANTQEWWKKSVIVREYQPYVATLGTYVSPTIDMLKQKAGESLQGLDAKVKSITQ